jgi:threonine dehydrogenase-like Zn-dependent dehydrogenase
MRAVTCYAGDLAVADVAEPQLGPGHVLLDVHRAGICGSDLHARINPDEQADVLAEAGYDRFMRSDQHIVLGHEIYGTVAEHGPGTRKKLDVGTPVVALPLIRRDGNIDAIGLSRSAPGCYADRVAVQESLTLPVPNGLPADLAALTEPLAIGWHAVRRSEVTRKDVAIVIGCGPVGLAVICLLKARGVRTIIASDLSAGRRALATACGADVVVDPRVESPFAGAHSSKHVTTVPQLADLGLDTMEKLTRLPVPWHHVWRLADRVGAATPPRPVVFECVGVPGMIDGIIAGAPLTSRVVVVGVCMTADTIRPAMAINKEIDLRFVVGYSPLEFRDTLHLLAEGKVNAAPIVTGTIGLNGVAEAFTALGSPDGHAKVLIDPRSTATTLPQPSAP